MARSQTPKMSVAKESGVARVTRMIYEGLKTDSLQSLFRVVDIEPRKDSYGFRMPENYPAANDVAINLSFMNASKATDFSFPTHN